MENNTNAANCLLLLYAFNTAKNVKRTRYADVAVQLYYIFGCVYCINIATNNNFNIF